MLLTSLTDVPRNLKEAIDWLMAMKGDNAENVDAMSAALHRFLIRYPVGFTEVPALERVKHFSRFFMKKPDIEDQPFVQELIGRYSTRMSKNPKRLPTVSMSIEESDYKNIIKAWGVKPTAIARGLRKVLDGCEKLLDGVKHPSEYVSAYSSEATWEASCSEDPEACAVILVGIAPMLYVGIRSLKDAADDATGYVVFSNAETRFARILECVGYSATENRANLSASDVFKALGGIDGRVMDVIYDLAGFWAFY
ncbi:hypothetical protein BBBOND_0311830 [Babesia bigemina]|uniref:Uncharacterized protein n=1 Tax=Babesia bigemina TaxID=5866 RepID=A0A061DEH3_BABBI|nr:hypothetical protein BBBOND_0311830 [Babesia bigemina]CDR97280.1 hypothetical protein BBBOND_0311830 [Babesia bigemina]|eukprot:XP_012769466.1 hypothetical protein BBBOND_0311830 [Babesia bigemina]